MSQPGAATTILRQTEGGSEETGGAVRRCLPVYWLQPFKQLQKEKWVSKLLIGLLYLQPLRIWVSRQVLMWKVWLDYTTMLYVYYREDVIG